MLIHLYILVKTMVKKEEPGIWEGRDVGQGRGKKEGNEKNYIIIF